MNLLGITPHTKNEVLEALSDLRVGYVDHEYNLQDTIEKAFKDQNIGFVREAKLNSRSRIDFLIDGGIGVEIKRGKPNRKAVISQLDRYATSDLVKEIILVIETSMDIPEELQGKPCISIGLHRKWGIAL